MNGIFLLMVSTDFFFLLLLVLLFIVIVALVSNAIVKVILRKVFKVNDNKIIKRWSLIVVGIMTLFVTVYIALSLYEGQKSQDSMEEAIDLHIEKSNLIGKSKKEVVEILGPADTTGNILTYDFSNFRTYVLTLEFKNNQVVRYHKLEK